MDKKPTKSIEQQAHEARTNAQAKKIDTFSQKIADEVCEAIWEENFDMAVFTIVTDSIKKKCDHWANKQVSDKKIQDFAKKPGEK